LGGPADLLERPDAYLEQAPIIVPVPSLQAGFATATDCRSLGLAVVSLGGGRRRPEDPIDFAVGLSGMAELGAEIAVGQPLAMVHARTPAAAEQAVREVQAAYQFGAVKAAPNPVTYRTIRP
ncbi:MAG: thymidine phosphorylase, partial [Pseudomonadota bacterium]|nr:thymidine phosphorylase [Pseudomonadota bacterium]